jgi:5-methylcytosine-specific restriction protein A
MRSERRGFVGELHSLSSGREAAKRAGRETTAEFLEELVHPELYFEGAGVAVTVNRYERNPAARAACIAHYGATCQVCDMDFVAIYGDIGKGFIHVHHLKPLAEIDAEYSVNPIFDLRPICTNCHAMIHTPKAPLPPLTIQSLRQIYLGLRTPL